MIFNVEPEKLHMEQQLENFCDAYGTWDVADNVPIIVTIVMESMLLKHHCIPNKWATRKQQTQ